LHPTAVPATLQAGISPLASTHSAPIPDSAVLGRDRDESLGLIGADPHAGKGFAGNAASTGSGLPRDTFAALDAAAAPVAPTWTHAGTHRAEAGFQDPAIGWVGVRADLSGAGIHATLVPGSTNAAEALGGHLAGLNSYLTEHHSPVANVTLAHPEDRSGGLGPMNSSLGDSAGGNGASEQGAREGWKDTRPDGQPIRQDTGDTARKVGQQDAETVQAGAAGADLRTGSRISVMA
jgi:hypothetical protein